jgi:hypothetical protein
MSVNFPVTWVGQRQGLHRAGNKACCGEATFRRVLMEFEAMTNHRVERSEHRSVHQT